jgi:hypothetical protein
MTIVQDKTTTSAIFTDGSELKRVLTNAMLFASKSDMRPVLNSIRIVLADNMATFEATDSYALFRQSLKVEGGGQGEILLKLDDAKALVKMLTSSAVTMVVEDFSVSFVLGFNATFEFRPIEGTFPDTSQLWDGHVAGELSTVSISAKLLERLGKLKTVSKWGDVGAPLKFNFNETNLKPIIVTLEDIEVLVMPCRTA